MSTTRTKSVAYEYAGARTTRPECDSPGDEMYKLIEELFPICRSITGVGTLNTLKRIQEIVPLTIHAVPTGYKAYDWDVPKEWNIRDAYIKNPQGEIIVDFKKSNLHVVSYSVPIHQFISLAELKKHLHTLAGQPDLIPYRTAYYEETWGFCMRDRDYQKLEEGIYEVFIDSTLSAGHMHYGELIVPGETPDEVLISTHICHPSLANDNLSGLSVAVQLAKHLLQGTNRYTYRFLFSPATIGPITWLSLHEREVAMIRHGLVAALLGDDGDFVYRRSRSGNEEIDRIAAYVLADNGPANQVLDFVPYGYDQRQFCSPGFDLAMGCLSRTEYAQFPEYHTSADNLSFVTPGNLEESLQVYTRIVDILEANKYYINRSPKTEPRLGKRGLYKGIGGDSHSQKYQLAMLWVLNYSDGNHSLLDIAQKSLIRFETIVAAARDLSKTDLLQGICDAKSATYADIGHP